MVGCFGYSSDPGMTTAANCLISHNPQQSICRRCENNLRANWFVKFGVIKSQLDHLQLSLTHAIPSASWKSEYDVNGDSKSSDIYQGSSMSSGWKLIIREEICHKWSLKCISFLLMLLRRRQKHTYPMHAVSQWVSVWMSDCVKLFEFN